MKESLASRVGRIISGGLHAWVDAMENAVPETVMEQAIREIDAAVDDIRHELGQAIASKHLANTRLMDENRKHEELSEKIELALQSQREDLAEAAVALQLDIEAQIPVLEIRIKECADKEKELEGFVRALQAKKREMREELRQFRESRQGDAVAAQGQAGETIDYQSKISKAESVFDRVMEKASGVAAGSRPQANDAAKLAELEDLARRNRVKERLAQLKNKANN